MINKNELKDFISSPKMSIRTVALILLITILLSIILFRTSYVRHQEELYATEELLIRAEEALEEAQSIEPVEKIVYISEDNPYAYHDYLYLATTILLESGGSLEESVAIGHVIMNRLADVDTWGDHSIQEVISHSGQFQVYSSAANSNFQRTLSNIEDRTDEYAINAKIAALYVLNDIPIYEIPDNVEFFYAYDGHMVSDWFGYPTYNVIGKTIFFSMK